MLPLFALDYFLHFSSLPLFFLSLFLITLNASVLLSRLCPGTGHIDYWTVRILTNLHFDSQVCFWINHCTCTHAGLLSSTSGTQPWVLGVRTDAIAYVAKNVQCWTLLHVMYSKLWHSYDVAQYLYNNSCKTSWEGLCATCIVAYCALHTVHNLWAMRIQVAC